LKAWTSASDAVLFFSFAAGSINYRYLASATPYCGSIGVDTFPRPQFSISCGL
jgi:hypothetical protein